MFSDDEPSDRFSADNDGDKRWGRKAVRRNGRSVSRSRSRDGGKKGGGKGDRNQRLRDLEGGFGRSRGSKIPELYTIHQATVSQIMPFGAFCELGGEYKDGLLHISRIAQTHIDMVEDVLSKGEHIWVKVVDVQDDGKYGLDMRFVSQRNGEDQDPNNIEGAKGTGKGGKGRAPMNVEAVRAKAVCTRCGTEGHIAVECFGLGKRYELLKDEDFEDVERAEALSRKPSASEKADFSTKKVGGFCIPVSRGGGGFAALAEADKKEKKKEKKEKKKEDKKEKKKEKKEK